MSFELLRNPTRAGGSAPRTLDERAFALSETRQVISPWEITERARDIFGKMKRGRA